MRVTKAAIQSALPPQVLRELKRLEDSSVGPLSLPRILGHLSVHDLRDIGRKFDCEPGRRRVELEGALLRSSQTWPTAIDLFSGCGGLTLGLKQARYRVLGAVDQDDLSVETYSTNHPEVTLWHEDIRDLAVTRVRRELDLRKGELDLLAGCPPCQGFSSLKTLNGAYEITDERNDLVFQFLRFVRGLRPRTVMMENVPGLATDGRMASVQESLEELGYTCDLAVLDAADFGVPQRRRRMIFLAGLEGAVPFAKPSKRRRTVSGAIRRLPTPARSKDPLHSYTDNRHPRIEALIRRIPKDGGSRSALGDDQLPCHQNCRGFGDVYGRMSWRGVSPTITSGCINPSKGRFLHPEQDRAITLREAALLQSFPRDYKFSQARGKYPAALMIGNALPPEFVRRHALAVRGRLRASSAAT